MSERFDRLVGIVERLRGEEGCPWDKSQTRESLKPFLLEEAYEVLDAIDGKNPERLKEELGDLFFQILFHSQISKENNEFDIEEVLTSTTEKMIRRHPHVFHEPGTSKSLTPQEVLSRWEEHKHLERKKDPERSALQGIPGALPSLLRAQQVQERAARLGFDWSSTDPVLEKVQEEWQELSAEIAKADRTRIEEEFGDLLFALVNYARHLGVQPEEALRKSVNRFMNRFGRIEGMARREGKRLPELTLQQMDELWEAAKAQD